MLFKMMSSAYLILWILATVNAKDDVNEVKQARGGGCSFNGTRYENLQKLEGVCIDVTCQNGTWESKGYIDACCRKCHATLDPHFWSFDDLHYDFHGTCNYSITQDGTSYNPPFGVFGEFNTCPSVISASCIDMISFKDNEHTIITLQAGNPNQISVNSPLFNTVTSSNPDASLSNPALTWIVGNCVYILGTQRLLLKFCWRRTWINLNVYAHPALTDRLYGLCGHYNYYQRDDQTHRDGLVTDPPVAYPNIFGESWMTNIQNNKSCIRQKDVKDVAELDPAILPFIDRCRDILSAVQVEGNFATEQQLTVYSTFCGADLFTFETEGNGRVDIDGYISAVKEMLNDTILEDLMSTIDGVSPFPCFASCGLNAVCKLSCNWDEDLVGSCLKPFCKCCRKKPTCGGVCGDGGSCRTCSCLAGEEVIHGQCPLADCRCCKKITPCEGTSCGENAVCRYTCNVDEEGFGYCNGTNCKCCKKKSPCGGACGDGGTCRTTSCVVGETVIQGQCPFADCRCCKKIAPCEGTCGTDAVCSSSCNCDEEQYGYCKGTDCKCCKKKPTCGGCCGDGGTCRNCSCLAGEQVIDGQCPLADCRCCKKIPDPCSNQRCGLENRFVCKPKTICKQVAPGSCSNSKCTCCVVWLESVTNILQGKEHKEELERKDEIHEF